MWINGRNPTDDSWHLIGLSGWLSGVPLTRSAAPVPAVYGVIPGPQQSATARSIVLTFECQLTAITARDAAIATLKSRLRGLLSVRFDDAPARVVRCEAQPPVFDPHETGVELSVSTIRATVTLTCYDGASYDVEPRVLVLTTTPTVLALGDLPAHGHLLWSGAWTATTTRTISLRTLGGVLVSVLPLTAPSGESLASTDFLEVDLSRRYLTKVDSAGLRDNQYDWRELTNSNWLRLDPTYGTVTLDIDAGSAVLLYRRAYAL